jgi:integrase
MARVEPRGAVFDRDGTAADENARSTAAAAARRLASMTINNYLTVLRKCLGTAVDWGLIDFIPKITWLKVPEPEFDFLDFSEAGRLLRAAKREPEWYAVIFTAVRTGLRMGELRALRWQDVDLVAKKILVRQAAAKNDVGVPKSGRSREVDLGAEVVAVLKVHRHLRGELVFSRANGRMHTENEMKHPLWRACKRAGLREIGWHALRHSFASHLVKGRTAQGGAGTSRALRHPDDDALLASVTQRSMRCGRATQRHECGGGSSR